MKQILGDQAPHLLPTPKEELLWLLKNIVSDLLLTLEIMGNKKDNILERQAEELMWSLAVLLKDPSTENSADVERYLTHRGILAEVQEQFNEL